MLAAKWSNDAANPFKATQKWNSAVNIFRVEMPVKSHRHFLRTYEDTFTGAEATTWFLSKLQCSNHFEYLSKNQVIALLDKFLKANVFEPVLGDKADFKPNNTLYQFPSRLPLRSVPLPNLGVAPPPTKPVCLTPMARSPMKRKSASEESLNDPKHFLEDLKAQAAKRQKNALETERVWETIILGRLEALFDGKDIQELIPPSYVNGVWVAENATTPLAASIKEYFEKNKRHFPTWVQSAMKNLSNWPTVSGFGNSHTYRGFEKDVLLEIVNYFKASEQPFVPFDMADVFRYAYIFLETQDGDVSHISGSRETLLDPPSVSWTERLKSVDPVDLADDSRECLSEPEDDDAAWRLPAPKQPPRPASTNPFLADCVNSSQLIHYQLPPDTCFETAFTSGSPTTRVVHTGTLKFCKERNKKKKQRLVAKLQASADSFHSSVGHVSGLERDMSSLSVERPASCFEPSHTRSHSGGYVNLALSQSMDDEEEPPLEELNMSTALATIKVLAKKAKQSRPVDDCNASLASAKTNTSRVTSLASGLSNSHNAKVAKRIYQLLLLLLPPDNRKKMSFLLQYMGNLISNKDLRFSPDMTNKEFVVQSFCEFVLGLPEAESAERAAGLNQFSRSLSCRVVAFLLDERDSVLAAPADLCSEVEQQLARFHDKEKTLPRPLRVVNGPPVSSPRPKGPPQQAKPPVPPTTTISFCKQVSAQQFEQQKCSGSQKALQELLELMINDKKMKPKEKERRLLMFKDSYPHIYMKRIPTKQDEEKIMGMRKKSASFTRLNFLRL